MTSLPITGVYNDGHVAELFERFRRDPDSVDESWRQYFRFAESLTGQGTRHRRQPGWNRRRPIFVSPARGRGSRADGCHPHLRPLCRRTDR
jgi:2-oxoglutarate dehydrogenase complex dehydrogenase (E1) component-like enzyme